MTEILQSNYGASFAGESLFLATSEYGNVRIGNGMRQEVQVARYLRAETAKPIGRLNRLHTVTLEWTRLCGSNTLAQQEVLRLGGVAGDLLDLTTDTAVITSADGGEWALVDAALSGWEGRVDEELQAAVFRATFQCAKIREDEVATGLLDCYEPGGGATSAADQLAELGTLELLWLPAGMTHADGLLTQWTDVSGKSNHGTRGAATGAGRPVPSADGGVVTDYYSYVQFASAITTIRTVVMRRSMTRRPRSSLEAAMFLADATGSTFHFYGGVDVAGPMFDPTFSAAQVRGGSFRVDGSAQTSTTHVVPADGLQHTYSLVTTANATATASGRDRTNQGRCWGGELRALAIYSTALDGTQIAAAEAIFNTF